MLYREAFYFTAIVEEKSLSKAADRLFVTQPTMSHFLSGLENELGTKLFTRNKNSSLTLTENGRIFYEAAKEIVLSWNRAERKIADNRDRTSQRIRCGTGGSDLVLKKFGYCLPPLKKRYPNISIHTTSGRPIELERLLLQGELDMAYAAMLDRNPKIEYLEVTTSEVDLVVPKTDPLAAFSYQIPGNENKRIPLSTVGTKPFALVSKGSVLREVQDQYFEKVGFTPTENATYSVPASIRDYIVEYGFFGLTPRHIHSDEFAYIALEDPMYYTCGIFYVKNAVLSPCVKDFIAELQKYPFDYDV